MRRRSNGYLLDGTMGGGDFSAAPDGDDEALLTARGRGLDWRFGAILVACYLVLVSAGLLFVA